MVLSATDDSHKKAAELPGTSMLQVINEDKDESNAVIEQEKEKKADKPVEAPKAEPEKVETPKIKSEE